MAEDSLGTKIRVTQLAGPGVENRQLHSDPPLYHFDVDPDQFNRLLADPVGFLAQLGLGPEQGIAPNGMANLILSNFNQAWTDKGWQRREINANARPDGGTKGCCYVSDDSVVCHPHG